MSKLRLYSSDKDLMVTILIYIAALILTVLCTRAFISAILTPAFHLERGSYNRMALRINKGYQVLSWGVITLALLITWSAFFLDALSEISFISFQ